VFDSLDLKANMAALGPSKFMRQLTKNFSIGQF